MGRIIIFILYITLHVIFRTHLSTLYIKVHHLIIISESKETQKLIWVYIMLANKKENFPPSKLPCWHTLNIFGVKFASRCWLTQRPNLATYKNLMWFFHPKLKFAIFSYLIKTINPLYQNLTIEIKIYFQLNSGNFVSWEIISRWVKGRQYRH